MGWTPDGRLLIDSRGQLWTVKRQRLFERARSLGIQLTSGEPVFAGWDRFQDRTLYAIGTTTLGQLQRFDTRSRTWVPHLGGISAESLEYSKDRHSVLYSTHPQGELWVRREDGSRPVQLTKAPMQAWLGRWSPDGRVITFVGKATPDRPWAIYLVDAAGGAVRPACRKDCRAMDLAWMPDGKNILFAPPAGQFTTEPDYLGLLDLNSGEFAKLTGPEGLSSPRISPGRINTRGDLARWTNDLPLLRGRVGESPAFRPRRA